MKIKDLCSDERPREKMLSKGASSLSNAELIAILLRTGTGKKNVIEVAQAFLKMSDGSLTRASSMSVDQMCNIEGIGTSKAIGIIAALELGKRMCGESPQKSNIIRSSQDVFREMVPAMRGLQHEECWIFYLARNNRIITKERLSIGGQSETIVEIKKVVRRALETLATAIIIVHNHPSGDPHPGIADIKMTKALKQALETFDISLTDHIIIADGRYYSFSDEQEYTAV